MFDELRKRVEDIKSICSDRMDARTADGKLLSHAFAEILAILDDLSVKEKKSK